ncbi:RelA/SpoT family protein [Candidatus Peregrinibacteria bacterium]|nr:RelA/SpoT family protein [Candidatus Peregrinibacteria bacterium]
MEKNKYNKYINLEELMEKSGKYLPDFDENRFRKAFEFSEKAHRGQFRKDDKTPYFIHPLMVVKKLVDIHADEDILIAAMLHDVPEDTEHTLHEINELFGEKVSFLVDGITKLSKVQYRHNMPERQVESLKKLFLHSAKDPRVIIIKLADRLHNMSTLYNIPESEKRLRIARETLEIFVPMANLLGIQDYKAKLEDLCFKYLFPSEYEKLKNELEARRQKNAPDLKNFIDTLKDSFKKIDLNAEISERKQNLYTIYKKLSAKGKSLDELEDRITVRIIMKTIPHCYEALGVVHGLFTPKISKFKDYIASPKINQYQSLHTMVFGIDGILTDVQIRTKEMHLEAKYGIAANFFKNKKGEISDDVRSSWVNKIIEIEKNMKASEDFLEGLKLDIFQERIFVFTPKGETIDLPNKATAIDFAYCIHSDVGNRALKANINGKDMPINTELHTGDVVKIIIDNDIVPSLSWLSFAKTNLAKSKIHTFLKKVGKKRKFGEGHKILQKEFDIAGLGLVENIPMKKLNAQIISKFGKKYKNHNDLYNSVVEGDIKAVDIAKSLRKSSKKYMGGVKVNVKVVAKNRFGLLKDVSNVFYKHAIDITYLKGWTHSKQQDAYFNVQVLVNDLENIGHIFDELEQVDGVKYIYRIPNLAVYISYGLVLLTGFFWAFHPLFFRWFIHSDYIDYNSIVTSLVIYSSLFLLFILVLFTTYIMKNYLPFVRKKRLFWIVVFGFPILAVSILLFELFYYNLRLSWLAILIELLIIYLFLGRSFLSFRKNNI